jgi:hypothetical protein
LGDGYIDLKDYLRKSELLQQLGPATALRMGFLPWHIGNGFTVIQRRYKVTLPVSSSLV